MEVELSVPWVRVDANRPGGAVCASLGPRTCATTSGFGLVVARGKWQLLDELRGSPLSLSVGPELRLGQHTGPTRARITNLGEGTTDLGATLAVGRSGGLAEGSWSAHADATYRRRGTNRALEADRLPGDELVVEAEAFFGARPWWSVGPTLSWWERPEGVDFGEGDLTDIDRFGALNGRNVRVGGKLLLRAFQRRSPSRCPPRPRSLQRRRRRQLRLQRPRGGERRRRWLQRPRQLGSLLPRASGASQVPSKARGSGGAAGLFAPIGR
jgi:hypothetical protein